MKHSTILLLVVFMMVIGATGIMADDPLRYAKEVKNVSSPYQSDWIISPNEEEAGDENVSNAPECDIKGVIACNDKKRLRVDILLNNPISYDWQVCYGVEFIYINDISEAYLFFPVVKKFFYLKWEDGEIVSFKELVQGEGSDSVGVTSSHDGDASSVFLIIDKDKHLAKSGYGQNQWIKAKFYSGYLTEEVEDVTVEELESLEDADETRYIRLGFVR